MPKEIPTVATKRFAQRLRAIRIARGVKTARKFAKILNINENRYTRYERAEVEPDLATLMRICEVLKVTPNSLLCETIKLSDDTNTDIKLGFSETASNIDYPAVNGSQSFNDKRFEATLYILSEKLGMLFAQRNAGGLEPTPFEAMKICGAIYERMRAAPFETIANIGREIDLSYASLEQQEEIAALAHEIADISRYASGQL